jgi:hypothetical protein
MDPQPRMWPLDPDAHGTALPAADVRIQTVACGRCGWPNACRTQSGMRTLRFMCQWCERMTTGIVDPSIKRNVIF